jgi:hypothetical protein
LVILSTKYWLRWSVWFLGINISLQPSEAVVVFYLWNLRTPELQIFHAGLVSTNKPTRAKPFYVVSILSHPPST